jgi:hypothetical protein
MTPFAFFSALLLILVSELLIACSATWLHATLGGLAALTFTIVALAAWLDLVPKFVSESEDF